MDALRIKRGVHDEPEEERLRALYQAAVELLEAGDVSRLLSTAVRHAKRLLETDIAYVMLLDPAAIVDTMHDAYGRLDYWAALFGYAAKIYFDFTGYSDIAIGASGLLGLRIPENFEMPYRTQNIAQFWRHWHMSPAIRSPPSAAPFKSSA